MNKNFKLAKNISLVVFSSICFIVALIGFIQSYSFSDEWGYEISFDKDYVALMLATVTILIYTIYILYMDCKNKAKNPNAYYATCGLVSTITFCYPLGIFLKNLMKALSKGKEFDYTYYQSYLYLSIIGLALLVFIIFSYLDSKKK